MLFILDTRKRWNMALEQVSCAVCGKDFVSRQIFNHISKTIIEENLGKYREALERCPECRREKFSGELVGTELERLNIPKPLPRRRYEEIQPVKYDPRTGATIHKSECFICNSGCDAAVFVKDGRVLKVEGDVSSPVTKGTLCSKGLSSADMLYQPERLLHPLKRAGERGEGKWQRISWDEALDTIVERLRKVEAKYGKDAVGLATGTSRGWISYYFRFANAFGRQHIGPGLAQCALPRITGGMLVTGGTCMECPDNSQTQCMIVWGANPPATWPVKALGMMEAKARGAKLIVVDSALSETASKADLWLRVRPGTDAALALGMLNIIITEGLFDEEFVTQWCTGFEELRERVQEYSPQRVEEITWVPREKVIEAAKMYATTKPACITQVLAIDQNADTISTSRAIAMLACLTGNIDVPGGNIFMMPMKIPGFLDGELNLKSLLTKEDHEKRLGSQAYPLLASEESIVPTAHNATFWKAILTGKPYPIRALYCHGSNVVIAYANTKMVTDAIMSLDFFVVADLFMTDTALLADIVLPAATWMERDAVTENMQVSYNNIHLQQKTVEVGECWTNYKILNEMSKRLGFGDRMFPSEEAYCDFLLKPWNMTFQDFKKKGIISVPYSYRKYEQTGFKTPSGKIEFYSQKLKDMGFDPLPSHREPTESPYSTPELARKYPLIVTTGGRAPVFRHAELRNIPRLREIVPELRMTIHPKTAAELGINDGDNVIVESPRGDMMAKAALNEGIDARVVQIPSHWPKTNNVNRIMDNENCAVMMGGTQLRGQLCRVRRAEKND